MTPTLGAVLFLNRLGWTFCANAQTARERRSRLLRNLEGYFRNSPNCLAGLLILSIRMTRRQIFALNTQDLLILLVVILLPLLLFGGMGQYEVGTIAPTVAVLMYVSGFILARAASLMLLPAASALAAVGLLLI